MKLQVKILDDNGNVIAEHEADACQPSMWRAASNQKMVGKMPQLSGNENNGTYELFGITFQPHVRVDRPNGWTEVPRPLTGQPPTPRNSFPNLGGMFAPRQQNSPQPNTGRVPGLRG